MPASTVRVVVWHPRSVEQRRIGNNDRFIGVSLEMVSGETSPLTGRYRLTSAAADVACK